MLKFVRTAVVAAIALNLAGCASIGDYCRAHGDRCIFAGIVAGAALAAAVAPAAVPIVIISDERVKTDIRFKETLPNGLKVYTYRYLGDERWFAGVIAQDLLRSAKFRKAVVLGADGYYRVDYAKLGVSLQNVSAMKRAGEAAARKG